MSNEPETPTSPYSAPVTDAFNPSAEITTTGAADATLGARIGAYLIDWFAPFIVLLVFAKISWILYLVGLFAALAYYILRDCLPFLGGQSLGKKILKIKAVTEDGKSLSGNWGPGIIRNVVLLIPFFPLVELIVLITSKEKPLRRLGDQWAKTKVVVAP